MKKLILTMLALAFALMAFAQVDVTIGTGTSTGRYPFNDYFVYSRSQSLYMEAEIGAPGTIHKLRWYRNDTGADPDAIGTTQIWLKTVNNAVLTGTDWEDPGTMVAEITDIDLGAGNAWYEVDIDDFVYTGGNLLVSVYTQDAPYTSPHSYWRYTSTTGMNTLRYGNSDSANPPTLSLGTSRPNIQINMTAGAPTAPPNAPILASPSNGGYAFIGDILRWNGGGGFPATYDVFLDTVDGSTLVSDNQTGTTYTPTLIAGNTYYWKVVASNSFGDSPASATWSFSTPGADQLVESFENTAFPPAGWANGTTGNWSRSTSYATHGSASATRYGSTSTAYILSTPKVTILANSTLDLWTLSSSTSGTLQVVYSADRVTWTPLGTPISHASTYTWYNTIADLSSLAGNNYYLGVQTGSQSASFYIDRIIAPDITPEAPGAPVLSAPADLAINVVENTTFTWTAPVTGGVPTGYNLYLDTVDGTTLYASNVTSPYTLTTPLAYNTTYYWTVEAYSGAGTGPQATVQSFTTRSNPIISSFPWTEGFEVSAGTLPLNWVATEGTSGASQHWKATTSDSSHGASAPASGTSFAYLYCYLASTTYNPYSMITPPVALDATTKRLSYQYWIGSATVEEPLFVDISNDNQATWTTLYTHSNASNTGAWFQNTISLEAYASSTVYLRFRGISNYGSGMCDLGIDDVTVEDIPAGPIFAYSPDAINFGTVMNGPQTGPQNVTITNNGGGTLNIS
ncbi:MAG: choice-of-anchor J domain-containing protein, partial [Candidatus Cloacimonetes bacterium]|nr:choice-of-anchor J domain-containing protein [Candidatus Cloacimonadota bacterium]